AQLEDRLANVKSLDDWNEVKEFINDIFNFRRNAILSLGNSIVVQNNGNLVLKANGNEYTFFARSAKDPNAAPNVIKRKDGKLYKFDDVSDLIEDIKASAKINISSSLLNGDNNTNLPTKNKFISRDKTGFHINIPAYNGKNAFDINNPSKYQEPSAKFTINEILNKYPESNGKEFAIQSFYLRSKSIGTVFGNPQHIKGTYVTVEDGKEVTNEVDEIFEFRAPRKSEIDRAKDLGINVPYNTYFVRVKSKGKPNATLNTNSKLGASVLDFSIDAYNDMNRRSHEGDYSARKK
ncbi:hypothetical protein ACXVWQ_10605, partial [Haemophilus sp. SZY H57]